MGDDGESEHGGVDGCREGAERNELVGACAFGRVEGLQDEEEGRGAEERQALEEVVMPRIAAVKHGERL